MIAVDPPPPIHSFNHPEVTGAQVLKSPAMSAAVPYQFYYFVPDTDPWENRCQGRSVTMYRRKEALARQKGLLEKAGHP